MIQALTLPESGHNTTLGARQSGTASGRSSIRAMTAHAWHKSAVVYQIYPRSFADGSGDGIGDLEGVISKLDYLQWLGVDAIWLSPIFPSPMADFGYDVSDYCDIDPLFGDLRIFDDLLAEAHRRRLKVMLDWVPNHTSIEHPWFVESRSSLDNPKRDWYIWRDLQPNGEYPNNWTASFSDQQPAWTLDPTTGQYYLHLFLPEQPDLNWEHHDVEAAMLDTIRFWLDRGVDGLRMDVVHLIGKDFEDDPDGIAPLNHVQFNDVPVTHEHLRHIRSVIDSYQGDRTSVGEVYLLDERKMATYYGDDDELHMSFNFAFLWTSWDAAKLKKRIITTLELLGPRDATPTWVLSNHDVPRHRQRYGGSEAVARAAAVMLLTLPGTAFVYQGEELGLLDAVVPPERVVDPGGRDGCRAPIPWNNTADRGWQADPWLPFPPETDRRNVQAQQADTNSIAHLYRRLLAARRTHSALVRGTLTWMDAPDGVLAYQRATSAGDRCWVFVNTTGSPQTVAVPAANTIAVSTDRSQELMPFGGVLSADAAVVLRPI